MTIEQKLETGFTPGPWRVGEYGIEGAIDERGYSTTVLRALDGHVYDEYDSDSATIDIDNPADARLIAAAPELYEALEAIILGISQGHAGAAAINAGVSALAKARGES
jgi:hypothetical protein